MSEPQHPTAWTDADFDSMSWHDCTVHGISLRNPGKGSSYDLIFDLDYILEPGGGTCQFHVAPAMLTFSGVDRLRIAVQLEYKEPFTIDWIERDEITRRAHQESGLKRYRYSISFSSSSDQWNRIIFEADGFHQALKAPPVRTDHQSLDER